MSAASSGLTRWICCINLSHSARTAAVRKSSPSVMTAEISVTSFSVFSVICKPVIIENNVFQSRFCQNCRSLAWGIKFISLFTYKTLKCLSAFLKIVIHTTFFCSIFRREVKNMVRDPFGQLSILCFLMRWEFHTVSRKMSIYFCTIGTKM